MLKTPREYADLVLALFYGDKEAALTELYAAARAHPTVPPAFFRDTAKEIER